MKKIEKFTDLNCWKEGHLLVLMIYRLVKTFPRQEIFVLVSQMLRAAISVTSNIAEGFARRKIGEKVQFYSMARASLTELCNQLLISKDVGYIEEKDFQEVWTRADRVKLISGLIRSLRKV